MTPWSNLCSMHRDQSTRLGSRIAIRFPLDGLFHDISWADYRRSADQAAAGLIELGVVPADGIAILSENRCEWFIADHAILSSGAFDIPLHAPLARPQVQYQVSHSGARGIIVSGQDQADKVFDVLDQLPDLEFLVSFDPVEIRGDRIRCPG